MTDKALSVLILAGGQSRRMGQDKVWLNLAGQPLVERIARRVLPIADELIFSTRTPERFAHLLDAFELPVQLTADLYPSVGPLAGIHAGLTVARHDLVLVLATDMPFFNLPLLRYMRDLTKGYDAVVPQTRKDDTGELMQQPLHAFYRRTCLPMIAAHLMPGDSVAYNFLTDVRTRAVLPDEIKQFDPEFLSFINVNTPDDWDKIQKLVAKSDRK